MVIMVIINIEAKHSRAFGNMVLHGDRSARRLACILKGVTFFRACIEGGKMDTELDDE
jgi:hypothetical protein